MKRLWLLRHANSAAGGPDPGRRLDAEGRREAEEIGAVLARDGRAPQLALSSSARRARETVNIVAAALAPRPEVRFDDELYLAPPGGILGRIAALEADWTDVLVVGHNPGLGDLAGHLAWNGEPAVLRALAGGLGTATFAEFHFDIDGWDELDSSLGRLVAVRRPGDAPGA